MRNTKTQLLAYTEFWKDQLKKFKGGGFFAKSPQIDAFGVKIHEKSKNITTSVAYSWFWL